MIRISPADLSADALLGVIEAFVLREGTDYGHREYSLQEKCAAVRAQLDRGEVELWFDAHHESVYLRMKDGSD